MDQAGNLQRSLRTTSRCFRTKKQTQSLNGRLAQSGKTFLSKQPKRTVFHWLSSIVSPLKSRHAIQKHTAVAITVLRDSCNWMKSEWIKKGWSYVKPEETQRLETVVCLTSLPISIFDSLLSKCKAAPGGNCYDVGYNVNRGAKYFKDTLQDAGGEFSAQVFFGFNPIRSSPWFSLFPHRLSFTRFHWPLYRQLGRSLRYL